MLISEMVSMLAMSKLMPTVTGPSGNKDETSALNCCMSTISRPHNSHWCVLMLRVIESSHIRGYIKDAGGCISLYRVV